MTEIHWERVEQVLIHLAEHPEQHDQSEWGYQTTCGTVACFGGWTVLLLRPDAVQWEGRSIGLTTREADRLWSADPYPGPVALLAAEALGLQEDDADWLFYQAGTLAGVVDYLNHLRLEDNLPPLEEAVPALREALARA